MLINPGAGWGAKRWPAERYAAVAQGLIDRGCASWSMPAPARSRWPRPSSKATGGAATPLTCSLDQLIALTRRVALVIAGDTGPLHLACALGRPVVGIYGPTDPSRNGPFGTRFIVLRSPESRRDHTRYAEPEAGLLTIQPEDVLAPPTNFLAWRPLMINVLESHAGRTRTCAPSVRFLTHVNHNSETALVRVLDRAPATTPPDWIARWQRVARRIRVPLGFLTAALYLFELWRRAPQPAAVAWSLALVLPGLWLRAYAAGYVKKNRELTVTGPYAHTRNPLYLGSMLIAAGFAVALLSWPVALVLAVGFAVDLRSGHRLGGALSARHFPGFRRLLPPRPAPDSPPDPGAAAQPARAPHGGFSLTLYLQHREYNAAIGAALLYLSLLFLRPAARRIRAWAAMSVLTPGCNQSNHQKEPCLTGEDAHDRSNRFLRPRSGRRGSRPAGCPAHAAAPRLQLSAEADPHLLRGLARLSRRNGRAAL